MTSEEKFQLQVKEAGPVFACLSFMSCTIVYVRLDIRDVRLDIRVHISITL